MSVSLPRRNMNCEALDIEFREAVDSINSHKEPFPADILLKLYAYYKKSTNDYAKALLARVHLYMENWAGDGVMFLD